VIEWISDQIMIKEIFSESPHSSKGAHDLVHLLEGIFEVVESVHLLTSVDSLFTHLFLLL